MVLTSINLLNYADRYVPSSVKELIKEDLNLSDMETALPATGMVLVYMVAAAVIGVVNDRATFDRRKVLAGSIAFWSLATALAGFSQNLEQLVLYRSLVGVGEAAFGTIVPPYLADFFPPSERTHVFGVLYLAVPLGGALGFGVGALCGAWLGWRAAFFACGLPGLFAAFLVLGLHDPPRGINDIGFISTQQRESPYSPQSPSPPPSPPPLNRPPSPHLEMPLARLPLSPQGKSRSPLAPPHSLLVDHWADLGELLRNRFYMAAVLGSAANTFALGGLADWYASFAMRYQGVSLASAGLLVGGITVAGGVGGNMLGATAAQRLDDAGRSGGGGGGSPSSFSSSFRVKNAKFLVPALFALPAALCLAISLNVEGAPRLSFAALALAEMCAFTHLAPISALVINVVAPGLRARAMGLSIAITHVLGDVLSPPVIGAISDAHGLRAGLQVTWVAILVSGLVWFAGFACLPPLAAAAETSWPKRRGEEAHEGGDGAEGSVSGVSRWSRSERPTYFGLIFGTERRRSARGSSIPERQVNPLFSQPGHLTDCSENCTEAAEPLSPDS